MYTMMIPSKTRDEEDIRFQTSAKGGSPFKKFYCYHHDYQQLLHNSLFLSESPDLLLLKR